MGFSCGCYDDGPEWSRSSSPIARSGHVCCECGDHIQPGTRYEYVVGKWDGSVLTFHTCERCADLRASYSAMGFCVSFACLWDDHLENLIESGASENSRAVRLAREVICNIRLARRAA